MEKTRRKPPPPHHHYQPRCIWALFSMFHFRHRPNRRFLSDDQTEITRDSGNRFQVSSALDKNLPTLPDGKERTAENAVSGNPSMKTLIEEEIFAEQVCAKVCQKVIMLNGEYDVHPDSGNPRVSYDKEKLGETIGEFVNQQLASRKQLGEDRAILFSKEELVDVLQAPNLDEESFLKHLRQPNTLLVKYTRSLPGINAEGDGILDSKPELGKSQGNDSFLNDNSGSIGRNAPEEHGDRMSSKSSGQIIIPEHGPTESGRPSTTRSLDLSSPLSPLISQINQTYKGSAPFSVASIKRKLKNVMGREQSGLSPEEVSKIRNQRGGDETDLWDNPGRNSPGKEHFYLERMAKRPSGTKGKERFSKHDKLGVLIQRDTMNDLKRREADIYLEAKKHLVEMLSTTDEFKKFSSGHFSKPLGRILSLPDYSSPLSSPSIDFGHSYITTKMRSNSKDSPRRAAGETTGTQEEEITDSQKLLYTKSTEDEQTILEKCNTTIQVVDAESDGRSGCNDIKEISEPSRGDEEIPHAADGAAKGSGNADVEETNSNFGLSGNQNESCAIGYDESLIEEHDFKDRLESTPATSPRSSSTAKKEEDFETVIDKMERRSPVSVLDPSLLEDDGSPSKISSHEVELRIQPMEIRFEDEIPETLSETQPKEGLDGNSLVSEYVKAVLQAARFNWSEHYLRLKHPDQLIDPSLFDGVDFSLDHCQHDRKLVFDCINEVLLDIYNDLIRCCPWVTFVRPGIRHLLNRESPVIEVCKGIHWHLLPVPVPRTLDHIVRKDLAKCGNWMDMHCDCESIGFNMADAIFEGLTEETLEIVSPTIRGEPHFF